MNFFRDQIALDIPGNFLCPLEFGETHLLDGILLTAVQEIYSGKDTNPGAAQRSDLNLHCKTEDLAVLKIRARSTVTFDGKNYVVERRDDDLGVTTLHLVRGQG